MSFDDVIRSAILKIANSIIAEFKRDRALMSFKSLVKYLDQSENTVREYYIYQDDFPVFPTGKDGSKIMYPRKAVDEWLEKHTKTRKDIR